MKKITAKAIALTILVIAVAAFLCGCNQEKKVDLEPKGEIQNQNEYITDDYSFTIPESWKSKFKVINYGNEVAFFSKAIYEINETGNLLSINSTSTLGDWENCPDYKYLGRSDEVYYYMTFPTDVQFDVGDDTLYKEYISMQNDIDKIIGSFVLKGDNVSYDEPHVKNKVATILKYIGTSLNAIIEDAKYTGGVVLTNPEGSVLPYIPSYEPFGGEEYYIYWPKNSTGRDRISIATINGVIVAVGFMMEDSTANVYQLIRDTEFLQSEPEITDIISNNGIKDITWEAENGYLNIRAAVVGNDYKGWVVVTYCFKMYE